MLLSMTGYGQAEVKADGIRLKFELKTLNSKFLDLNLKLPKELSDKESDIRNYIQHQLIRGKVNLQIELEYEDSSRQAINLNEELFEIYFNSYKKLAERLQDTPQDLFRLALHSPEVMASTENSKTVEMDVVSTGLQEVCQKCLSFRKQEGANLEEKLTGYISEIGLRLEKIGTLDKKRIENIRQRIDKNLEEIRSKTQVDENRFEQELIYYVEKLDITEEKVRLKRHLDYFMEVIAHKESQGKKLGFISQEIGREINTIGSKANDAEIQQLVVEMKDELEKIKEQLLNIL